MSETTLTYNDPTLWSKNSSFSNSASAGSTYNAVMQPSDSGNRIVTTNPIRNPATTFTIKLNTGYDVAITGFRGDKKYYGGNANGYILSWTSVGSDGTTVSTLAPYLGIVLRRSDTSVALLPEDVASAGFVIEYENSENVIISDLTLFGLEYPDTAGFKVKDENENYLIYDTGGGNSVLGTKTITENGTYSAMTYNYDGFSSVSVNVSGGGSQSNDFIVTLSYNSTSEMWEPNCTYAELMVAYTAEKNIIFVTDDSGYALVAFESYDTVTTNFYYVVNNYDENDNLTYYLYGIAANNSIFITDSYTYYDIYDATAVAAHVKNGDTFYASTGKVTGSATARSSTDLTASGDTVTAPAGFYENAATKTVASGTEGTPTATKGTVSNHAVSVTPSVTNAAGYITGGTHSGTAVSVSASELVSGTLSITSSGTKDVTNYASASVAAGTEGTPSATKGTVSNHSVSVTPSVTNAAGYITGGTKTGTAVSVSASELVSGSETKTANGTYDVTNLASLVVAIPFSTITTSSSNPTGGNNGDVWIKTA